MSQENVEIVKAEPSEEALGGGRDQRRGRRSDA